MKKLICALALMAALSAKAQIIDFAYHLSSAAYPLNGGNAVSGGGLADPGANGIVVRTSAGVTTAGPLTGDVTTSGTSLATTIAVNAVTNNKLAQGAANTVVGVAGNATANRGDIQATTAGTGLTFDGTNLGFNRYPVNSPNESIVYQEGSCTPSSGAAISCGSLTTFGTGTNPGNMTPTLATDGNHPNVAQCTTGTTATGTCAVGTYHGHDSNTNDSIIFGTTAATTETEVQIPTASGATNTYRFFTGFCDTWSSNGDCTDGVGIYWDNNSDTHWGCETASNAVRTTTLSTTVATAAAWHRFNVQVNAAGTSATFTVDGSALSCSPLTTNIPTGITRGVELQTSLKATAGCATTATCVMDWNYIYYRQAVTR